MKCHKCGKPIPPDGVMVWENNKKYHGECWLDLYQARRVAR
jgi:hypothetical protein